MKSHSRGIMLIELLGALAIGSLMLAGLSAMVDSALEDTKAQQAAHYHSQVVSAANKYIKANYSTLAVAANATTTAKATVADLIAGDLLPANFGTTNPYGQSTCILIRATSKVIGGQTVYFPHALVVTEGTAQQAIPEKKLFFAAAQSGMSGGAISSRAPGVASGSYNAWKLDGTSTPTLAQFLSTSCSGNTAGSGSLVSALFYDGPGQLSTDFLYRNPVPGRPELNRMNTPLQLASSAIVAENAACGATAAIAVDAARNLMTCDLDGVWKRITTWKRPVATYDDLPGVLSAATDVPGDVRMTSGTGRAFMYLGGTGVSSWAPLAVDQNGDLYVARNIEAENDIVAKNDVGVVGNINMGGNVNTGGNVNIAGSVNAGQNVNAGTGAFINGNVSIAQGLFVNQSITATGNVHATDINANGNVHAAGSATISNNANIGKVLTVGSDAFMNKDVYIVNDAHVGGTVY